MTKTETFSNEDLDPVFRELGAALYVCQAFEHSLCYLLALNAHNQRPNEPAVASASFDLHSTQTLGSLIKSLKKQLVIPQDFETKLTETLQLRNKLVHGYCTKNASRFVAPKDRLEMIKDLKAITRTIRKNDLEVCRVIDRFLEKFGLSTEITKEWADETWRMLNFMPPDGKAPSTH